MGSTYHRRSPVQHSILPYRNRRGITVLALLLLIIALVIVGFFVVRYLGTGDGPELEVRTESSRPGQALTASAA
jgi:hypothetical protein